jgi:tyrosyl-tRNA synthetase
MDLEKRLELITRNTEEIMTLEDLKAMLENQIKLRHYIGFEISGKIHLGTGLMCMSKVKDFMDAGMECQIFLADWHSWINDKLGGDMELIGRIAGGYFKEGMKASLKCMGGVPSKLKFILGSELYHNNDKYWQTVIEVSKNITLARTMRSITIMGRKEGEGIDFAKLIYPPMQASDVFMLDANIPHAGLDQRSAHVIAREVAEKLKVKPFEHNGKKYKPVAIHHHLLLGLQKPAAWPLDKEKAREIWSEMKMSKSVPNSAVFIHDSEEEIRQKLNNAFCPEKNTDFNPVLDWTKHLIFRESKSELKIERPEKFGGDIVYSSCHEIESDFVSGKLHPLDLKKGVAEELIRILKPARQHFKKPRIKKMKEELEALKITR